MTNHSNGCGICAMAYVTKISASKLRKLAKSDYPDEFEIMKILKSLGYKVTRPLTQTIRHGKKYIATVASLNYVGGLHFVVIYLNDNYTLCVYDPAGGNKYVGRNRKTLKANEFKIESWTSIIAIPDKS